MENKIDFSKFCEEAHSICKDCRVAHICKEREKEESSNSYDGDDFETKDTWFFSTSLC